MAKLQSETPVPIFTANVRLRADAINLKREYERQGYRVTIAGANPIEVRVYEHALPKLQARLMAAIPTLTLNDFAYHATDLYVVWSLEVAKWLKHNYEFWANVTMFTSQIGSNWNGAGKQCYNIPFAGHWPNSSQRSSLNAETR